MKINRYELCNQKFVHRGANPVIDNYQAND